MKKDRRWNDRGRTHNSRATKPTALNRTQITDKKAYRFEVRPVEGRFEHAHEVLVLALQHAYTQKRSCEMICRQNEVRQANRRTERKLQHKPQDIVREANHGTQHQIATNQTTMCGQKPTNSPPV